MNVGAFLNRVIGSNYWNAMRWWNRFEIQNQEKLVSLGPAIIVAYHGHAAPAGHLLMLKAVLGFDWGEPAYGFVHNALFKIPYLRGMVYAAGFIPPQHEDIDRIFKRGLKLVIAPGQNDEVFGGRADKYRVNWGENIDYLQLALKYQVPVVPLASSGVDDAYVGLFDSKRLWRRLGWQPGAWLWVGMGAFGPWPFSPPRRTRIVQRVGEPIDLLTKYGKDGKIDIDDRDRLLEIHREIEAQVQRMIHELRAEAPPPRTVLDLFRRPDADKPAPRG